MQLHQIMEHLRPYAGGSRATRTEAIERLLNSGVTEYQITAALRGEALLLEGQRNRVVALQGHLARITEEREKSLKNYTFTIVWSPNDNEWVAVHGNYPSLSGLGATPEAALAALTEALK